MKRAKASNLKKADIASLLALLCDENERKRIAAGKELARRVDGGTSAYELLDRILKSKNPELRRNGGYTLLAVATKKLGPNDVLPAKYDTLVTLFGLPENLRAIFARIPEPRRTAVLLRELAWCRTGQMAKGSNPYVAAHLVERLSKHIDDLLSHDAAWIVRKWSTVQKTPDEPFTSPVFAKLRTNSGPPASKSTVAAGPTARPAARRFVFDNHSVFTKADWDDLDAVERHQFRTVGAAYLGGGSVKDVKHYLSRAAKERDDPADDLEFHRWDIYENGEHVFDAWIVFVDHGVFFEAGTKTRLPLNLLQGKFQRVNDAPTTRQLAAGLAKSAPEDLWDLD